MIAFIIESDNIDAVACLSGFGEKFDPSITPVLIGRPTVIDFVCDRRIPSNEVMILFDLFPIVLLTFESIRWLE